MKRSDFEIAADPFKRAVGIMFRKKLERPMLFDFGRETKVSIHSFFCFISFDAVLLDKEGKVAEVKKNIRPFSYYSFRKKGHYLIEMPAGNADKLGLRIGKTAARL